MLARVSAQRPLKSKHMILGSLSVESMFFVTVSPSEFCSALSYPPATLLFSLPSSRRRRLEGGGGYCGEPGCWLFCLACPSSPDTVLEGEEEIELEEGDSMRALVSGVIGTGFPLDAILTIRTGSAQRGGSSRLFRDGA